MSMIFDSFTTGTDAQSFVEHARSYYGLDGQVFDNEAEAMEHDPFPWSLVPPIVHIDRMPFESCIAHKVENRVEALVTKYGGVFQGT